MPPDQVLSMPLDSLAEHLDHASRINKQLQEG
jgi:hypothetical protein